MVSPDDNPDGGEHRNPRASLPDSAFWQRAVAGVDPRVLDPVTVVPFSVRPEDRVVTAGACFARHIAHYLRRCGYNHFVTEDGGSSLVAGDPGDRGYGIHSARYGDVPAVRQLLQLFRRAFGEFTPAEDCWAGADGVFVDPFRPRIPAGGFRSPQECRRDRIRHLAAVKRAFIEADVFVYTFGSSEAWVSAIDGAVYAECPGLTAGRFDPERHRFHEFGVDEVVADTLAFIDALRRVNPRVRIVLTVSAEPLAVTHGAEHVLVATMHAKSVLRVAAGMAAKLRSDVAYFPSYEIVAGSYARGRYYSPDLCQVTDAGVLRVVRIFLQHFGGLATPDRVVCANAPAAGAASVIEVSCHDETSGRVWRAGELSAPVARELLLGSVATHAREFDASDETGTAERPSWFRRLFGGAGLRWGSSTRRDDGPA